MTEPTPPAAPNYKDTLNLPKTNFDMKANLTQREPAMLADWQKQNLYQKIRTARAGKEKWVLHDGPPYANGDIHMGHLINKVLKDIVVKFRTMQGLDSPYVPGWDCHGLPIESAIQKELGPKFRELTKDEVRQKCRDYALKYVKLQGDSFQRLGILGDFAHPYLTLNPKYESGILDVLAELVSKDLVYRQKKPVHWCTNDRTALAEAELEYQNKKDTSIYVKLVLIPPSQDWPILHKVNEEFQKIGANAPLPRAALNELDIVTNLLIWTTTPWTIPANRAVAVNPKTLYSFVRYQDENEKWQQVIIADELVERVMKYRPGGATPIDTSMPYFIVKSIVSGSELEGAQYSHPFDPMRLQPIVLADYVTTEDGTGLVHTAPGHGKEDYQTGIKYGLEIYNPVLADGRYDDTVPLFLQGKSIWDANQLVIDKLEESESLFHAQSFDHEYPHCWRCKKPVIFRATEQWFINVDKKPNGSDSELSIRERSLQWAHFAPTQPRVEAQESTLDKLAIEQQEARQSYEEALSTGELRPLLESEKRELFRGIEDVHAIKFIPEWGANRLNGMILTRPDWCISRQRSWGVPIPAFFDEKGNILLTEKSVRHVAAYFKQHGADAWYTHTPTQILGTDTWTDTIITPDGTLRSAFSVQSSALSKSLDILDVWFESGASHHAVLECTHPELGYPAKLYLEGSDQHRGWFQSSLLEAAGYKDRPPFEAVLTHGFVVDEKGQKYSKSSGNYVPVDKLLTQYGADVLRLWVSSVDYQNDIKFGSAALTTIAEAYRKIRNTIRYLLGNLYDFNPQTDSLPPENHSINRWMFDRAQSVFRDCYKAYDTYEFHNVFKLLYEFCNVEISAIYAKAIKDRLYCELPNSPKRRAAQTLCYQLLVRLVELTAPILAFTAEESWTAIRQLPGCASLEPTVHLAVIPAPQPKRDDRFAKHWEVLMPLVEKGNKQLDDLKKSAGLGNALDAEAVIIVPNVDDEITKFINAYGPELEDALGVGFHRIEHGEIWDIEIHDTREIYPSCARSWKRRPDVGTNPAYPDLSKRDAEVVHALRAK
jgi:isoleucyl-tRNA synthetase